MATTYEELFKKVLLRLDASDGKAHLAAKESVNDAMTDIARVWDVDELIKIDTTSAATIADTKSYEISTFSLTRFKDFITIRLEDTSNTRKLRYKTPRWIDENIPYPENQGTGKSIYYTRRGTVLELFPLPDDAYTLYIHYTQWPLVLSADSDEMSYSDEMRDVVISLATERAQEIVSGGAGTDWTARARAVLAGSFREDVTRPDEMRVAQPFRGGRSWLSTEYWKDPFIGHGGR